MGSSWWLLQQRAAPPRLLHPEYSRQSPPAADDVGSAVVQHLCGADLTLNVLVVRVKTQLSPPAQSTQVVPEFLPGMLAAFIGRESFDF